MEIRKTSLQETDRVMPVYEYAREFMRKNGNRNQWIDGYPTRDLIETDIRNGYSYLCMENDRLLAVFCLMPGPDPCYREIYGGKWLNDHPYGVIHRLAAAPGTHGTGRFCLAWCSRQYGNLRADTHRDNIIMQKLLVHNGFLPCGIIRLKNGSERIAYHKAIP